MPAWRIDPPRRCFQRQTSSMKSLVPAMTPPIGAPRPFEKVDPGGIPLRGHLARGDAGRDAGVEQPRAIHVGGEPVGLGDLCDLVERGLLPDRAAADIGGLFDADHGLRRLVARARMQRRAKGFRRKLPVVRP